MKDLNKIIETEIPIEEQKDLNKESTGSIANIAPKAPAKRIRVRAKTKPALSVQPKSDPVDAAETTAIIVAEPKSKGKVSKKEKKDDPEIGVKKSLKKAKAESKPLVKKEPVVDLKEEKTDQDKKVTKKLAKKAEEKVAKLKKKVKKAKKKDVKKSKIKALKNKLENALEKMESSLKKLKKAKK